jgi:CDP-glucose 4,6-dehydratase
MLELWGENIGWKADSIDHPYEASHLQLNATKAGHRLNWRPIWDLRKALWMTVDWHRSWLGGGDMNIKCLDQISEYQRTT